MRLKNIIGCSALLLLSASCSEDLPERFSGDGYIRFTQVVDTPEDTRGTPITGSTLTYDDGHFGIYGYVLPSGGGTPVYQNGFFNDTPARVQTNGSVDYGTPQLWPDQDNLRFLAYYPHQDDLAALSVAVEESPASDAQTVMTLTYTAPQSASAHKDLMYAVANPTSKTKVNLNFEHALTRLTFQINKTEELDAEDIEIEQIAFTNINNQGVLAVSTATTSPQWVESATTGEGTNSYKAVYENTLLTTDEHTAGEYLMQKDGGGNSFMVIPMQRFGEEAKLEISYTLDGSAKKYEKLLKDITIANSTHKWEMGEHVNYRLTMDEKGTGIEAHVLPWNIKEDEVAIGGYRLKVDKYMFSIGNKAYDSPVEYENVLKVSTTYPGGWEISNKTDLDWLTIKDKNTHEAITEGDVYTEYELYLTCEANSEDRSGTFIISAGQIHYRVAVIGSYSLLVDKGEIELKNQVYDSPVEANVLKVSTNHPYGWRILSKEGLDWLTIKDKNTHEVITEGDANIEYEIYLTCEANPTSKYRDGFVIISAGEERYFIDVVQWTK